MLEGEQQVLMKANELLEKTQNKFQIYASADYLSELYYNDFSDKLKSQSEKVSLNISHRQLHEKRLLHRPNGVVKRIPPHC